MIIDDEPIALEKLRSYVEKTPALHLSAVCRNGFEAIEYLGDNEVDLIVTDINGSREIIRERENGLIIPPRDAESLYRAMKQMAEDSVVREKMAAKARPLIATRYEQTYVRRCLKEYYAQILQK